MELKKRSLTFLSMRHLLRAEILVRKWVLAEHSCIEETLRANKVSTIDCTDVYQELCKAPRCKPELIVSSGRCWMYRIIP
jgi:hypothetical protein